MRTLDADFVAALDHGRVVWGPDVSGETWPTAARSYLGDGTGVAWDIPGDLWGRARFVIDAEIVAPMRPALRRRYGDLDPATFAHRWTRAEAFAKLDDTPIITWLQRHGLDLPEGYTTASINGRISWCTETRRINGHDVMITFAAAPTTPEFRGCRCRTLG